MFSHYCLYFLIFTPYSAPITFYGAQRGTNNIRITIEKINNKAGDRKNITLVYYYGSHTDENGKTKHNRKKKALGLYLYSTPTTGKEKQHNDETLLLVEQIREKQLLDAASGRFGITDIPILPPEVVAPNLIKLALTLDIDQLTKELAKQGYHLVKANP